MHSVVLVMYAKILDKILNSSPRSRVSIKTIGYSI